MGCVVLSRKSGVSAWWAPGRKRLHAGAFGIGIAVAAMAGGPAAAQRAPMNPIEAFFSLFGAPPQGPAPKASTPLRSRGDYQQQRRSDAPSRASTRSGEGGGGSYLVCVRTCDGSFFPVSTSGVSRWDRAEEVCGLLCPNATMAVYSMPFGGTIDEAASLTGQRYSALANAGKFLQSWQSDCTCRRPGQSWADALRPAEARFAHGYHDILVTQEASDRMARPVVDPKAKVQPAALATAADPPAPEEPQKDPDLDVNGVDTGLKAATATLSHEVSGIRDEDSKGPIHMRLKQGRIVEGVDPNGSPRPVRVLAPVD